MQINKCNINIHKLFCAMLQDYTYNFCAFFCFKNKNFENCETMTQLLIKIIRSSLYLTCSNPFF